MWPDTITEDVVIQAFCNGDVALTGEIDSKLDVGRSAAVYEVLPDKVYKGRVTIPVFAISETGGRCGYPFVAGKRYLIYASITLMILMKDVRAMLGTKPKPSAQSRLE